MTRHGKTGLARACAVAWLLLALFAVGILPAAAQPSAMDGDTVTLDEAEIAGLNVQTIVELLNRIPGVSATELSVSLQGSYTKHVLVLLDGRPLNDPVSGWVDLGGLTADRLREVRVIKGSGAVEYGDNTNGGVVLITSKQTSRKPPLKVEAYYGTYDTRKGSVELAGSALGIGAELAVNSERTAGYRFNGDSAKNGGSLTLDHRFDGGTTARLALSASEKEAGYTGRIYSPTPNARSTTFNGGALLNVGNKTFESRTYANRFSDDYKDPDRWMDNHLSSDVMGEELRYTGAVSAGLKYEQVDAESNNFGTQEEHQESTYLLKQFTFADLAITSVTVGVRANHHSVFGDSYNPQLGISAPVGPLSLSLEVNRSSNTPSVKQRYYESSFTRANPGLDMEEATNVKLVLTRTAEDAITATLAGIYSKIDRTITYIRNPDDTYAYQNLDSTTRQGVDIGIDWKALPQLTVNLSYLYLRCTDDTSGLLLPMRPEHKASATFDVTSGTVVWTLAGNWVSDSYDDKANTDVIRGRFTADAKANWRLPFGFVLVSVGDLFNESYEVHLGYPSSDRTVTVGFSAQF